MIRVVCAKIFAFLSTIFWTDKRNFFPSILASFWAIQHIACAYGCPEGGCDDPYVDPSLNCSPIFDLEKISEQKYDECEQAIAENLKIIKKCDSICANESLLNKGSEYSECFESAPRYCLPNSQSSHYEECGSIAIHGTLNKIHDYANQCPMTHLESDRTIPYYKCENGERVSIEEGKRRIEQLKKELDK